MPLRRLISVPAFIAVAALVVVAPRVLLIVAAAVAVVALLMWGLGGESSAQRAKGGPGPRPEPLPAVWRATLVSSVTI